ncbi:MULTISPECIES: putative hydro-lyase [Paraburkholderia]|uniref:putative hydro-lyase n=1 Tax=Paraburkholderia TaxID=1822464 RepID=UPI003218706A
MKDVAMRNAPATEVRRMIRRGELPVPTTGFADGYMQANLAILPESYAADFRTYCLSNPKSCPLVGVGKPGQPGLPGLGEIDIRMDVARYRVYRNGVHTDTVHNLDGLWREDLVTFALGCSFSFESAILKAGIDIHHISGGRNVPMYVTNIETNAVGRFKGPMVVSMRSFRPKDLIQAIVLSQAFPLAHGAPVHIGDPAEIGIRDIHNPDFGDPPVIAEGDIPGFWACGVTPQMAIRQAKPDLAITHEPGYMLVTDLPANASSVPQQALGLAA